MIQSIINGIIKAIRTEYDKSHRIYTESVEQGLKEPCFIIRCLNPSGEREISNRFKRYYPFMITYIPSTTEPIAECNDVCENLLTLLYDIGTDIGVLHAFDTPSGEIVDGNLQFSVQYQLFAHKYEQPVDGMDDLIIADTNVV